MKVSTKLFILIAGAILLFILSFGVNFYFDRAVQKHYALRSAIKNFEINLLNTIMNEKEYNRHPTEKNALKVLRLSRANLDILNNMLTVYTSKQKADIGVLSERLQNYQEAFKLLSRNNDQLNLLKQKLDQLFETLHAKSMKVGGEVDVLIGMAYLEDADVDPGFNSFVASNTR